MTVSGCEVLLAMDPWPNPPIKVLIQNGQRLVVERIILSADGTTTEIAYYFEPIAVGKEEGAVL